MAVVSLPVIPDTYRPVTSHADADLHWKSIEAGRARWVARIRPKAAAAFHVEWRRVVQAAKRGTSVGHSTVLVEQAVHAHRDGWEDFLYTAYASVAQDFARRTAAGLKAHQASETKAEPDADILQALIDGGLEDRWTRVVAQWLGTEAGTRIRHIQATTLADVRRILQMGAQDGLSIPNIARRLEQLAPDITARRAVTIARTEVISASNLGARAGATDTGLQLDHVWISTPGPRTRPWHRTAGGQTQPMAEPFIVKGQRLMFPGDGSLGADASNLVMCRCTVGYRPATS